MSLLRLGLGVLLLAALLVTLMVTHRSAQVQRLVFLFAVVQLIVSLNASLAALLQASGTVGGLAVVNVVTKLLWGGGVLLGILVHAPLEVLALALVLSESVKAAFLFTTVRRELGLDVRLDVAACTRVLRASLPFYVNGVVLGLCAKLDVTMLEFLTGDDRQVGWYSASANIAGLALLVSPLLGWVVMPLMSRALNRSREDFWAIVRRSMEGVYVITIPIVLLTILGADVWVGVIFGRAFGPAAMSLRALAPLFMLTYLAILLSMALIILGRGWTLTLISVVGLMVNPVLILLFVPVCQRLFGDGGSGVGAALGVAGMEMVVTSLFLYNLGRDALDRRIVAVVLKGLVSCAIVAVLHFAMRPLGSLRLLFDAVAYVAVAVALGVVRPRQVGIVLRAFRTHQ